MPLKPPVSRRKAEPVSDVDESLVWTAKGQVIPYKELEELLQKNHIVFISDLKKQTAHQAAKRISAKLNMQVKAYSATRFGVKGYGFMRIKKTEARA